MAESKLEPTVNSTARSGTARSINRFVKDIWRRQESIGSKVNSFLCKRGNRILVVLGSSLLSLMAVSPYAESYFEIREQRRDSELARSEVESLEAALLEFCPKVETIRQAAEQLQSKLVSSQDAETFRKRIIAEVRAAGCELQSLTLSDRDSRRWMEDDNPLNDGTQFDDYYDLTTDYLIETQVINLVASGRFKDITTLLKKIRATGKMISTHSLEIQSDSESAMLTLRWQIKAFNFEHSPIEDDIE